MLSTPTASTTAPTATPSVPVRRRSWQRGIAPLVLLVGALALRLLLWDRAVGFEQGDPLEYVNIAYKLAFGIGIEWWDLRPLLLSLLYMPVLFVAQWWPDPTGEAMVRALRLVSVGFGVGLVGLTYLLGRQLSGEVVGVAAGVLVAVNPVVNRMSVSTYAELPSTFCIVLGIWLLIGALAGSVGSARRLAFAAGLAIGAACMIRYQAIFYLPPIGVWVAAVALVRAPGGLLLRARALVDPKRWSEAMLLGFGGGLGLAVLAQALIELAAYGRPFHSLIASFAYNVTSGLAPVEFGQEPFDWYLRQIPSWLGVMTASLVVIGVGAAARSTQRAAWALVGLSGLVMFAALSTLPHKEERFLSQIFPLAALFAAGGLWPVARVFGSGWTLRARTRKELARRAGTAVMIGVVLAGCAGPMLVASLTLDLEANVGYVYGVKRAAELRPGSTLGTVPWNIARPYAGTRLTLERMDRNIWNRRDEVTRTIEQSDFLLFPEFWLLEDREIDKLVDAGFRSIEAYDDGVVLYQSRRIEESGRRLQP